MSEDVSMDEATNTALLLEQHIQKKMAHAVNDFLFSDNDYGHQSINSAIESGNLTFAAHRARETLILQLVHSPVFQNNLNYLVKTVVQEEMTELRRMVREEFARGIMHNIHNANRTG